MLHKRQNWKCVRCKSSRNCQLEIFSRVCPCPSWWAVKSPCSWWWKRHAKLCQCRKDACATLLWVALLYVIPLLGALLELPIAFKSSILNVLYWDPSRAALWPALQSQLIPSRQAGVCRHLPAVMHLIFVEFLLRPGHRAWRSLPLPVRTWRGKRGLEGHSTDQGSGEWFWRLYVSVSGTWTSFHC